MGHPTKVSHLHTPGNQIIRMFRQALNIDLRSRLRESLPKSEFSALITIKNLACTFLRFKVFQPHKSCLRGCLTTWGFDQVTKIWFHFTFTYSGYTYPDFSVPRRTWQSMHPHLLTFRWLTFFSVCHNTSYTILENVLTMFFIWPPAGNLEGPRFEVRRGGIEGQRHNTTLEIRVP